MPFDQNSRVGSFVDTVVGGDRARAYIPQPLPPEPSLDLGALMVLYDRASAAVGRLDGVTTIFPSTPLFLYMYVRKEALLSSQIEGTQSSLSDLLLFESDEIPHVPIDDVTEVSNYVAAVEHGVRRLRDGFPLSLRLIREMHAILIKSGERFMHTSDPGIPPLIKAGLVHVQFETIHPFLDGNGRIGRLLIPLLLHEAGVLQEPSLYLSLFLRSRRDDYYRLLQEVRREGAWETWLEFFLTGVAETAEQAAESAREILALFDQDRQKLSGVGRASSSILRVHEVLQSRPVISIKAASSLSGLSFPTVDKAFAKMEEMGLVRESTGRQRGRVYAYAAYLDLLDRGTDPLSQ